MGEVIYIKVYELSRLVLNHLLFNALWLILNTPIWIVLIQLVITESIESLYILIPLLTVLSPFVFFPSTQALFNTMREMVIQDKWLHVKEFFLQYKSSFKQSLITGIMFAGVGIILGVAFFYTWQISWLLVLLIGVGIVYFVAMILYYFFMEAQFNMTLGWKLKHSILFIMRHPGNALFNLVIVFIVPYIIWSVQPILSILFSGAVVSYFSTYIFIRKYNKLMEVKKVKTDS